MGVYRTIVVDPPWVYGKWGTPSNRQKRVYDMPYPTLTIAQIEQLPISSLAQQEMCEVYLWTTNKYLPHAFRILSAWQAQYCQTLTWCKTPRGTGQGGIYTPTTEFALLGRYGKTPAGRTHVRIDSTWFHWKRPHNAHSKKPQEFYELIERVTEAPRIELFARAPRAGWHVWGNEVTSDIDLLV